MPIMLTVDLYSGRRNPAFLLDARQERELEGRMRGLAKRTDRRPSGVFGGLGYRGMLLTRISPSGTAIDQVTRLHEGVADRGAAAANLQDDALIETWLLEQARERLSRAAFEHVARSISARRAFPSQAQVGVSCPTCQAADAPAYDPGPWNTQPTQDENNCYNYANNQITNTFAQPGKASGHEYTSDDCGNVQTAATSDGLVACPNFSAPLTAGQGWYVALAIWPDEDYHWYRQDSDGCWSHKIGDDPVTNLDNAGNTIQDPQTCDRGDYTDFCTYMVTKASVHIA